MSTWLEAVAAFLRALPSPPPGRVYVVSGTHVQTGRYRSTETIRVEVAKAEEAGQ